MKAAKKLSAPRARVHRGTGRLSGTALAPLVMRGCGVVAGLLLQVLLARMLGAEGYGVFAIAMCLQAAAVVIGRAGLDTVVMQVGGPIWFGQSPGRIRHVYAQAMRLAAANGIAVAVILAVAGDWLAGPLLGQPALAGALPWMALSILPSSLVWVHAGMLRTLELPGRAYLFESALMPALLSLMITLAGLMSDLAIERVAMLYCLATCLVLIPAARQVRAVLANTPPEPAVVPLDWRRQCLPVIGVDTLNFLLAWAPFVVLAAVATSAESGLFNVAARLALQVGTVLVVLGNVFAPQLAALCSAGDREALEVLARRITWLMIAFGSVPLTLILFAPGLALWVFGPEFVAARDVLQLLALGHLFNALTGPAGFLLVAAGEVRRLRAVLAASGVFMFTVCWWWAEHHGAVGAALAATLGIMLQNLFSSWLVWKHLGIQHIPFLPRLRARAVSHSFLSPVQESSS